MRAGASSPDELARVAAAQGTDALAITDVGGVYGAVRFQKACEASGVKPLFGAEVTVDGAPLVLLAASNDGYANLCRVLTAARARSRKAPHATMEELDASARDLFCLTGTHESRLWSLLDDGRPARAKAWVDRLRDVFEERLSIEVAHHLRPGDNRRLSQLARLSEETGVPLAATGDVRYATAAEYKRYDLLCCIREGRTVFDGGAGRPTNAEAHLKSEAALRRLIAPPEAFERAADIASRCTVDLLPGAIMPPKARVPDEHASSRAYLRVLSREALRNRYERKDARRSARRQLERELNVIEDLHLEDFFLVVYEVVREARRRGIRCAGRGSAANSITAYLLGITAVDPLEHELLFERFLHRGRSGTPDIDVDFDAERREEVIGWMEERFGAEKTAMTATVVTYRLRSAARDVAKALGWPRADVDDLTSLLPRRDAAAVGDYADKIRRRLGNAPLVDTLIKMVASLDGCPRHLGLHAGGMILSRRPLDEFTPVQASANGVTMIQFDKDDAEAIGLVKLDVLGLRMLSTLSETVELVNRHEGSDLRLDRLPLDDIRTFNLIRAGDTIGCFQIESQGQMHLLAQHQPSKFNDLITEVALFRPGPLQSGMVHPFVRRRRGRERVRYDHPSLKPILKSTYGVILFQEQVLEVAHRFAGMPLEEADAFRKLISSKRNAEAMEKLRDTFVRGACEKGVPKDTANKVFEQVSGFVGYGFCRSHAAAFAKTVYHSAYLKYHHPAAFMAAVMQHRPGMYSQMTLEEEARRFGVDTLLPDINRSGLRFQLEQGASGARAIRKPLTAVADLSLDGARRIVWARLQRPFDSVEDLYRRVALSLDALKSLARSGALDAIATDSRTALWQVGVLHRRFGPAGQTEQPNLFEQKPTLPKRDIPDLPSLTEAERLSWDYQTHGAARRHPLRLVRRSLNDLEIRPIETCYRFGRYVRARPDGPAPLVAVAGLVILRQKPPTAGGVTFVTLQDETGFVQCVVPPEMQNALGHVLTRSALIVRGDLQIDGNWRGLIVREAWVLDGIFGGYEGHPSVDGGRDRWKRSLEDDPLPSSDALADKLDLRRRRSAE